MPVFLHPHVCLVPCSVDNTGKLNMVTCTKSKELRLPEGYATELPSPVIASLPPLHAGVPSTEHSRQQAGMLYGMQQFLLSPPGRLYRHPVPWDRYQDGLPNCRSAVHSRPSGRREAGVLLLPGLAAPSNVPPMPMPNITGGHGFPSA